MSAEATTGAVRAGLGLRAECGDCFALCCVALAFERSADFPERKAAGEPCRNLDADFRCGIHAGLRPAGWNGCTVYDCFGAGQKVSQLSFGGTSWREAPETRHDMFALLPVMRQLHELLWYLSEAVGRTAGDSEHAALEAELRSRIDKVESLSRELPAVLLALDVPAVRGEVNELLVRVGDIVRARHSARGRTARGGAARRGADLRGANRRGADLIGADLRGADLRGANLRGAYLIAADLRGADLRGAELIGADLRDARVADADLGSALFLTQAQVNAASGNAATRIPAGLDRPTHWGSGQS